jgi:hypothetical protein
MEDDAAWSVRYVIEADSDWITRSARVTAETASGTGEVRLDADGPGVWRVDGRPAPHLDGCLDVDLEASAFTNAFPVHRLELGIGDRAEAPAAYVRALDARTQRLEQSYSRLPDAGGRFRYQYEAPAFAFTAALVYDEHGLVLEYPGLATRII